MNNTDRVLTAYEASKMCGLPKEAVEELAKAGKIKGYQMQWRKNAWCWFLSKSSVQRFLSKR